VQTFLILKQMIENKLTVVIRGDNPTIAEKTADACVKGGIKSLEVTFTVPKASKLIETLTLKFKDVLVGAGTVLDSETARIAILSGAKFIVSPTFDKETAKLCNRYHIPYIPGCMTVNEMQRASEYGVMVVKLFPGELYNPSFIKNILGPYPYMNIMPTGGITIDNVQEWIKAGSIMVGVGGEITHPVKDENYEKIEYLAKEFMIKVKGK
jgi:2-dehydro-3-deoxyphosphogluconate aldolase / (4S)-4-hydroxy-2-oxoglutarate aldolase